MCRVLQVSEVGYYKWLKRQSKPYKYDELLAKIRQIRADNPDYGAYRIYLHLQLYLGYTGSYYVILKLCKVQEFFHLENQFLGRKKLLRSMVIGQRFMMTR